MPKKLPLYRQLDAMDCGPTCLRMVSQYYGKSISLQELRERSQINREGVSLLGISEAAEAIGFRTRAVKLSYTQLAEEAPLPCIVHWNQEHFVVVYEAPQPPEGEYLSKFARLWKKTQVKVADPAKGMVEYTVQEFCERWGNKVPQPSEGEQIDHSSTLPFGEGWGGVKDSPSFGGGWGEVAGVNLSHISHSFWRSKCGTVMQDGFIFSESIARNIAVGDDYPDFQKLMHAAKVANIQDFVESLPLGFQTKIGAEGNGISQGQKQRILIARAVYKNPEFLFFDEATNALDAHNERVIMENLQQFFEGKTVVVVAHRLSTVKNADKIVVLEKGRIIEEGTHHELSKQKGAYYALVKDQLELGS